MPVEIDRVSSKVVIHRAGSDTAPVVVPLRGSMQVPVPVDNAVAQLLIDPSTASGAELAALLEAKITDPDGGTPGVSVLLLDDGASACVMSTRTSGPYAVRRGCRRIGRDRLGFGPIGAGSGEAAPSRRGRSRCRSVDRGRRGPGVAGRPVGRRGRSGCSSWGRAGDGAGGREAARRDGPSSAPGAGRAGRGRGRG